MTFVVVFDNLVINVLCGFVYSSDYCCVAFVCILWHLMATTRMMSSSALKLLRSGEVRDNPKSKILYIKLNSHDATVQYEKYGDVYDLTHTSIPDEFQGQGLGSVLAERVFDHLVQNKRKMKLTCEFLIHFYSKNENYPKYKDFVVST